MTELEQLPGRRGGGKRRLRVFPRLLQVAHAQTAKGVVCDGRVHVARSHTRVRFAFQRVAQRGQNALDVVLRDVGHGRGSKSF